MGIKWIKACITLHHAGVFIVANNRSPAGKMKGPDLRLDEKERTVVAKQPVKKAPIRSGYF